MTKEISPDPSPDWSAETPDLLPRLEQFPWETIIYVERFDIKIPADAPDPLSALMLLTNAESIEEIGAHGPSVASCASKDNEHIAELRRFEVGYGRDVDIIALLTAKQFPTLLKATARWQAERQGLRKEENTKNHEEYGNHVHEDRQPDDPIAIELSNKEGWEWPYYGSIDVNPLFVRVVAEYCRLSKEGHTFLDETYMGRDRQMHTMQFALDATMHWITKETEKNPEGLLESYRKGTITHGNHNWMDSTDSAFHANGVLANDRDGVASLEVQSYVYDAYIDTAELYEARVAAGRFDNSTAASYSKRAISLREKAKQLQEVLLQTFWIAEEKGGYFASGSDRDDQGNMQVFHVRRSNMGHLLNSHVLDGDEPEITQKKEQVIRALFSNELLAASGIRTLANDEIRFHKAGYHNGNVWLWDTYYTALGLERHGYYGLAHNLKERIKRTVAKFHKYPEFAMGGNDEEPMLNSRLVKLWDAKYNFENTLEQPPQEIQAWTVAAMVAITQEDIDRQQGKASTPLRAVDQKKMQLEDELLRSAPVIRKP